MGDMRCLENVAVILPSLDPDHKFENVVKELIEAGFKHIVIVDDGSSDEHQKYFNAAELYQQCSVLHHGVNKGKGRALKTAFEYVLENLHDVAGVVTIDGDGQHLTKDIISCGNLLLDNPDKIIIGCRDFDAPGVPARSVAGNKTTSRMFRLFFGIRISDTQTGLRAFPAKLLPAFCVMEGERFEYETNMLLQMKRQNIGFVENPIETVYDPDDYSSHYNALKDSWRIFKVMMKFVLTNSSGIKYAASSVSSWIVDTVVYYILFYPLGTSVAQIIARVLSSLFNFNVNKYAVFGNKGNYFKDLVKYYCVCIPQTAISVVFLTMFVNRLAISNRFLATLIKICVDIILFLLSYFVQKKWVFKKQK